MTVGELRKELGTVPQDQPVCMWKRVEDHDQLVQIDDTYPAPGYVLLMSDSNRPPQAEKQNREDDRPPDDAPGMKEGIIMPEIKATWIAREIVCQVVGIPLLHNDVSMVLINWKALEASIITAIDALISPSPCGKSGHRQVDLIERRSWEAPLSTDGSFWLIATDKEGNPTWKLNNRKSNCPWQSPKTALALPCGRCESEHAHYLSGYNAGAKSVDLAKARSEALEEAKERLDALCKAAGGHPSLEEIYTAIRGEK